MCKQYKLTAAAATNTHSKREESKKHKRELHTHKAAFLGNTVVVDVLLINEYVIVLTCLKRHSQTFVHRKVLLTLFQTQFLCLFILNATYNQSTSLSVPL